MLKQLLYGTIGVGAFGILSICDICTVPAPGAATLVAARAAAFPALARASVSAPDAVAAKERTVRLAVQGMTCGGCAISTRAVLARVPGVTKAVVSYEKKQAIVTFDPSKATVAQLIAAVATLGYTATEVEG